MRSGVQPVILLALAGALLAPPDPAAHQLPATPAPARNPGIAVAPRPATTLVAVTVVVPAGSADDPAGVPGAARLAGETIALSARQSMDPEAVSLAVEVERAWTAFTLLATPGQWARSWATLEDVLFCASLGVVHLEAARAELLAGFDFTEGLPVREFRRELYRTLGGATHPWSREPRGTTAVLRAAELATVEAFRRRHYQPGLARAAVFGPVAELEAREVLSRVGAGPHPEPALGNAPAWDAGDRLPMERDVTNVWIGAAFPAPPELPRTRLEFLTHQLEELLNPSPPDPGLFSAVAGIEDTQRGPVVVVEAAVMPEVASSWERRILSAVERLRDERDEAFFSWQRRRFRSAVLLREGPPEEATLRMALDLLRDGTVRALCEEVWAIGPGELARTAAALGAPRILVMGPELAEQGP